jgi:hypothetical protein
MFQLILRKKKIRTLGPLVQPFPKHSLKVYTITRARRWSMSVEIFSSAPKLVKSVNSPTFSAKFFCRHRIAVGKVGSVKLVSKVDMCKN